VDQDLLGKLIAFHDIDQGKTLECGLLDFLTKQVCSLAVGQSLHFLASKAANLADSFEDGVHEKIMSAKFVTSSLERTGKFNFEVKDGKGNLVFQCKDEDEFVDQILNRFVREYYMPLPPEGQPGPSGADEEEEDEDVELSSNPARNAQRKHAMQVQRYYVGRIRRVHDLAKTHTHTPFPPSQALVRQASRMRRRAAALDGGEELPVGAIVRLSIHNVDRAKCDNTSAICVVVEKEKKSYRVANAAGVYKELVSRPHLQYVKSTNLHVMGLEHVMQEWKDMPHISVRGVAASASPAGGQGFLSCKCRGPCDSHQCSCMKVGRICNSRCHPTNSRCRNHD
jgi:hypothetical protein